MRVISEKLKPGNYTLKWDGKDEKGRNLPQGIYFYCLEAGEYKEMKKMMKVE